MKVSYILFRVLKVKVEDKQSYGLSGPCFKRNYDLDKVSVMITWLVIVDN